MALTFKIRSATGDIWTGGLYDQSTLITMASLEALINSHSHGGQTFTLDTHSEARTALPVYYASGSGPVSLVVATSDAGANETTSLCYARYARSHNHDSDTLEVSSTVESTGRTPRYNYVKFASGGAITCHKVCDAAGNNCYDPYVLYGRYDDHYHALTSDNADDAYDIHDFPSIEISGSSTSYNYFEIAQDDTGLNADWYRAQTHGLVAASKHTHDRGTVALSAHPAQTEAWGGAGSPSIKVAHATGRLHIVNDVNGVGMYEFWADVNSHTHPTSGVSATYGATNSGCFRYTGTNTTNDSFSYFHTAADTWVQVSVIAAAHNHALLMT